MTKKQILRAAAFVLLFALCFVPVNRVFSRPAYDYNFQMIRSFYQEPENSLDAVYIGSSNCFTFWNPLAAWNEFGIRVYHYACDAFPFEATSHIIEEVHKTQPDSLIIVNLNTLHDSEISKEMTHYLVDNMPASKTKLDLIQSLAAAAGWSFSDCMELYFPLLRFHSRWNSLEMGDFVFSTNGLKGVASFSSYLDRAEDISDAYITTDDTAQPNDWMLGCVDQLLSYCTRNDVNILFVAVPRAETSAEVVGQLNYLQAHIEAKGYPVLNLIGQAGQMGMNLQEDYYNNGHANIHGSLKFTRHLSRYLMENYGFQDKRTHEADSWDQAWDTYSILTAPYLLDFETNGAPRDFTLAAPGGLTAQSSGNQITLTWEETAGAEGYRIYRRLGNGPWQQLAAVLDPRFTDTLEASGEAAFYRVVPLRTGENGESLFGHFSTRGIRVPS